MLVRIKNDKMTYYKTILLILLLTAFQYTSYSQNVARQLMKDFPTWIDDKGEKPHPKAKVVGPGLFTHTSPLTEQYSNVKMQFAGTESTNFYIREKDNDSLVFFMKPDNDNYWSIDNSMWSPNGAFIAVKQIDDHEVPEIKLTKSESSELVSRKYSRAGDAIPKHNYYVINVETREKVAIQQIKNVPYIHLLDWSNNSQKLFFLMSDRLLQNISLMSVDATTGKPTTLLTETSNTYLVGLNLLQGYSNRLRDSKQFVSFEDRNQFSWMSERSGYNQIYLYDDLGNLIRPLTNIAENGIVISINEVDKQNGWIYFLAHANENKQYETQLFRTNLKTSRIEKITDKPGILNAFLREDKDTLWVLRSHLPTTLQLDRYSVKGKYYDTPWEVLPSIISNNQLNYEYESTLAADGITELQSLILKPIELDPNKSYPIVEYLYVAPHTNVVPRDLLDNWLWTMNNLAQSGFIVVFTDGRGTRERGKKFNDFSYGKFGQIELEDHINALKQIGMKRPYMDLNRVGVLGHSWGGHFALRALLDAPEFYKAGHINAASLNPKDFRIAIEPYMGCLPQDCPEKYEKSAISNKLTQLKAPLMVVHGTFDDDVPIEDSYKLVGLLDQMKYENYEFDIYDGDTHIVMRNRQWLPKMINFFTKNLK